MSDKLFLGTGWSFPPSFSDTTGTVVMASSEEDIQQSLNILLSTAVGERFMRPAYGCDLKTILFEPLNTTLKTYLNDLINTAIIFFEPRIKLIKTDFEYEQELEGVVKVSIEYEIKATNSRINQVFPFYLDKGEFVTTAS